MECRQMMTDNINTAPITTPSTYHRKIPLCVADIIRWKPLVITASPVYKLSTISFSIQFRDADERLHKHQVIRRIESPSAFQECARFPWKGGIQQPVGDINCQRRHKGRNSLQPHSAAIFAWGTSTPGNTGDRKLLSQVKCPIVCGSSIKPASVLQMANTYKGIVISGPGLWLTCVFSCPKNTSSIIRVV